MAAYVQYRFTRGFLLDEERLRKLYHLVSERVKTASPPQSVMFKVYRGDAFSYTTTNIDDVLAEENTDWRRLTRLDFLIDDEPNLVFQLMFDDHGSYLGIEGIDRDQVFLLFSDIRDYMNAEVARSISIPPHFTNQILAPFLFVAVMIGFLALLVWHIERFTPTDGEIRRITDSANVNEKIDFLIARTKTRSPVTTPLLMLLPFGALALLFFFVNWPEHLLRTVFVSNIFVFGAQRNRHERRRRLVANLMWGIIVAFVVSVVAGLFVWRMTMP